MENNLIGPKVCRLNKHVEQCSYWMNDPVLLTCCSWLNVLDLSSFGSKCTKTAEPSSVGKLLLFCQRPWHIQEMAPGVGSRCTGTKQCSNPTANTAKITGNCLLANKRQDPPKSPRRQDWVSRTSEPLSSFYHKRTGAMKLTSYSSSAAEFWKSHLPPELEEKLVAPTVGAASDSVKLRQITL